MKAVKYLDYVAMKCSCLKQNEKSIKFDTELIDVPVSCSLEFTQKHTP